jgi:DNA polymerase-3 subunit delta'
VGFSEFLGNERIVAALRGALRTERVPHALLFTGPRGVGKFTLARMFAQAANCERLPDDFCGECDPCKRIALLADPQPLIDRGLAERGESPDAATVERIPLILQTHPDVWALVPDPIRSRNPVARPVLHVGQLRAVQRAAYFKPGGRRRVFILDSAETMRWDYANIFLKILEEPPESATLILLAPNPFLLLPTIRSRCLQFFFAPLETSQVEKLLEDRTKMKASERKLAAQLSEGSPGVAMALDLDETMRLRREVLRILELSIEGKSFAPLFTATSALTKNQKQSFENVLELFYSLTTDLLELSSGSEGKHMRNPALRKELEALSKKVDFEWAARALDGLDELHGRLRRNINRQLGLDALGISLAVGEPVRNEVAEIPM